MVRQQMISLVFDISLSSDGSRVAIGAPALMMEMEIIQVMSVFISTIIIVGLS